MLKVSRILHAGYIFESSQTKIAFDPIFENPFSQNCYAYPPVQFDQDKIKKLKLDAVFISHYHDDHCSLVSLNLLDKTIPIYIFCIFEELLSMIRELGFKTVVSLELNKSIEINDLKITPLQALDAEVDSIFHIQYQNTNVLNVVDSWIDADVMEKLLKIKWDLILWPFQVMREIEILSPRLSKPYDSKIPIELELQLKLLKPRYIVPSACQFIFESWSWMNHAFFGISYLQFETQIKNILPESKIIQLDPGFSIQLNKSEVSLDPEFEFTDHLNWIKIESIDKVDYHYQPSLIPPSTSEIAQHFEQLDPEQLQVVFDYCKTGLLDKYRSLDFLDSEFDKDYFFSQARVWKLIVYDHQGLDYNFYYQIRINQIQLLDDKNHQIEWLTEIPIAKFYGALKNGESLTSMYIRINDFDFVSPQGFDYNPLQDPLVRCLYNAEFGSYQKAQLIQIRTEKMLDIKKIQEV